MSRGILLFDGECGVCTFFAGVASFVDVFSDFLIVPYQLISEEKLKWFGLSHKKCAKNIRMVTDKGKVHSGAFAINYFLMQEFPWGALAITIYSFPPLLLAEMLLYEVVNKGRHRLSRLFGLKPAIRGFYRKKIRPREM